jgi:hypothetical protein
MKRATGIDNIKEHAEVSEKAIEKYLCRRVSSLGGICLKYSNPGVAGYPDRVALLPGGRSIWFELKSAGRTTSTLQDIRIAQLERIGHTVYVVDSKEKINGILEDLGYAI